MTNGIGTAHQDMAISRADKIRYLLYDDWWPTCVAGDVFGGLNDTRWR